MLLGLVGPGRLVRGGEPFTTDQLIVPSRDGLSICVDLGGTGGPLLPSPVAVASIRAALDQIAQHPLWAEAGYAKRPPVVSVGCPVASVIMAPEIKRQGSSRLNVPRRRVDNASPFRVWVVVLPDQRVSEVFADTPPYLRSEPEEIACEDAAPAHHPVCRAVSLGAYLTAAEFGDNLTLLRALTFALNLGGLGARRSDPVTDVPPGMVVLAESKEDALRQGREKFGPLPSPTPFVPPPGLPPLPPIPPLPSPDPASPPATTQP
jgi:hypothetical protein